MPRRRGPGATGAQAGRTHQVVPPGPLPPGGRVAAALKAADAALQPAQIERRQQAQGTAQVARLELAEDVDGLALARGGSGRFGYRLAAALRQKVRRCVAIEPARGDELARLLLHRIAARAELVEEREGDLVEPRDRHRPDDPGPRHAVLRGAILDAEIRVASAEVPLVLRLARAEAVAEAMDQRGLDALRRLALFQDAACFKG